MNTYLITVRHKWQREREREMSACLTAPFASNLTRLHSCNFSRAQIRAQQTAACSIREREQDQVHFHLTPKKISRLLKCYIIVLIPPTYNSPSQELSKHLTSQISPKKGKSKLLQWGSHSQFSHSQKKNSPFSSYLLSEHAPTPLYCKIAKYVTLH